MFLAANVAATQLEDRHMAGETIAVIADDASLLELIEQVLEDEGYKPQLYRTASDAAEGIGKEPPDLIILDLHMPTREEGWGTLERLKANPPTRDIPIILCSGDWQILIRKAETERMGCSILRKPFDVDELLTLVQKTLEAADSTQDRA
jgi:CheY-like chemotaxis protein